MPARRTRRHHHHVYVVQLDDRVWNEPGFRRANPDYALGKPFVYVGMTGLDPDIRFDKHAVWMSWILDFYVDITNVAVMPEEFRTGEVLRYVLPTMGLRGRL